MSINDINNSPIAKKEWIVLAKQNAENYYSENNYSLVPLFENELREAGFEFEISNQTLGFMPKHKKLFYLLLSNIISLQRKNKKQMSKIIF